MLSYIMKYYTTYEITNIINNKYYIGRHTTDNLDDAYYGSGKAITAAIRKYGKNNFIKIITGGWRSPEILWLIESWIVDEATVKDKMSYNMTPGGKQGGFEHINNNPETVKRRLAVRDATVAKMNRKHRQTAYARNKKGAKNNNAKTITVYNSKDEAQWSVAGGFNEELIKRNLPRIPFKKSYKRNQKIFEFSHIRYENRAINLYGLEVVQKYSGWYATSS